MRLLKEKVSFLKTTVVLSALAVMVTAGQASAQMQQGIYEIASAEDDRFVLDAKTCTETEKKQEEVQLYLASDVRQQQFFLRGLDEHSPYFRIVSVSAGTFLTETSDGADSGKPAVSLKEGERISAADGRKERELLSETASGQTGTEAAADPGAGSSETDQTDPGFSRDDKSVWLLQKCGEDAWYIRSSSGLYLTMSGDRAANGVQLSLEPLDRSEGQKWILLETDISVSPDLDTDSVNPYLENGLYETLQLTVRFGKNLEKLSAADLAGWMAEQPDHTLALDKEKVTEYVSRLAEKYNTKGKPRRFMTSYGNEITLKMGNFGWELDQQKTVERILTAIRKSGKHTIQPVWKQTGGQMSTNGHDIGDSYIEVDLIAQKVWLYIDGEKRLEADCVTGTLGTDRETPGGVYRIVRKQSPAVLTGPGYVSNVSYWMPFYNGYGLHDATWRSEFGGEIYKTSGSHGCVNLPLEIAEEVYELTDIGFPVVLYH